MVNIAYNPLTKEDFAGEPGIQLDIALTCTTHVNITVDKAHPPMSAALPHSHGLSEWDSVPHTTPQKLLMSEK